MAPSTNTTPPTISPIIHIATFNVENLLARYKFSSASKDALLQQLQDSEEAFLHLHSMTYSLHHEKQLTANLILEADPDILCLQEIESLSVLEHFNRKFLRSRYPYCISISAHDPRLIDSAVLSKMPFGSIRTNRHVLSQHERLIPHKVYLFPRDCLEVEVLVPNPSNPSQKHSLWLFCNHFTSMMRGREESRHRRQEQAKYVANRIDTLYKSNGYNCNFMILGDLNDKNDDETALTSLLKHPALENVVERLPKQEQWTHYFPKDDAYSQLDYILVPKPLMRMNPNSKPQIHRKGMPRRATRYTGPRYTEVGEHSPKASDHAMVSIHLRLL